jgi:hydroxymethylbilane synthase
MTKLKVGTRGSRLAVAQTRIVEGALRKANPSVDFELVTISTKGDVNKRPLFTMDEKGIFEKEVNEAVITGDVDFAVHSLKDIPSNLSDILTIACIPKRGKPNDVLVNGKKIKFADLPSASVIGTSSLRRAIQALHKRPDLNVRPIRGNVETRVKKSITGEYDSLILAEAGLTRLNMRDVIVERFGIKDFLPSPGQGAIAIVCRKDDLKLIKILKRIEDWRSRTEINAERSMLRKIEGGCRFPVGTCAISSNDSSRITLHANVFSADGTKSIKVKETGSSREPNRLGIKVANLLIQGGTIKLAEGWRDAVQEWNKRL